MRDTGQHCNRPEQHPPFGGGGIACGGRTAIFRCIIEDNVAYVYGGGISCWDNATVSNCLIVGTVLTPCGLTMSPGRGGGIGVPMQTP
jgi:hypothetical protein